MGDRGKTLFRTALASADTGRWSHPCTVATMSRMRLFTMLLQRVRAKWPYATVLLRSAVWAVRLTSATFCADSWTRVRLASETGALHSVCGIRNAHERREQSTSQDEGRCMHGHRAESRGAAVRVGD